MYSLKSFLIKHHYNNLGLFMSLNNHSYSLSENSCIPIKVLFFNPKIKNLSSYRRYIGIAKSPNLYSHSFYSSFYMIWPDVFTIMYLPLYYKLKEI